MADPVTWGMAIGAGAGALMDEDKPLRGAAMGAMGGAVAAPALAGTAGTAGAYSALPTLTTAGQGSQAAMLAAQTGEFGLGGAAMTGEALASVPSVGATTSGLYGAAAKALPYGAPETTTMMNNPAFKVGMNMNQQEQPQAQPYPVAQPMPRQAQSGGSFRPPMTRKDPRSYTQPMSTLAMFRGGYGF